MIDLGPLLIHVTPFVIILSRLSGLCIFAPVLGASVIPAKIKVLLCLALTSAVYAAILPALNAHGAFPLPVSLFDLIPLMMGELLIGLVVGYIASLPMIAMEIGGQMVGQQLGLGFARAYNPAMETDSEVVGQLLFYLALSIFITFGGVEIMFRSILHSFETVPPGGFGVSHGLLEIILGVLLSAYELAVRIAAPILSLIFLQTLALGFMSRTAPAFNILSLGCPRLNALRPGSCVCGR
jgi:flagellar biosynthetic protein FliR